MGAKNRVKTDEIIGFEEIETLDDLIRAKVELLGEHQALKREVSSVLRRELASPELMSVIRSVRIAKEDFSDLKQLAAVLHNIPEKLYYFLWSLQNGDVMHIDGVISSFQLRKAVFYLCKFLLVLEVFLKRVPRSIPVYENLGFVYLDLAGIAQYSHRGLMLKGRAYPQATLLRRAIACFQTALRLEARHGKELDFFHKDTLRLLDKNFDFHQSRVMLYLNPWYYLYISSALRQLNDDEGARAYLQKARTILNGLSNHLNARVKSQHELLEAVYVILKEGDGVKFDFEGNDVPSIERKIEVVRSEKRNGNASRNGYSPLVEAALTEEYRHRSNFQERRILDPTQQSFLRSIFTLYRKIPSSVERDQLIYRLNIPPLKIKGRPRALKGMLVRPNVTAPAENPPLQ
jgi:tetratricopeptide (TPR) repeat protein